jgi:hypothetical protein
LTGMIDAQAMKLVMLREFFMCSVFSCVLFFVADCVFTISSLFYWFTVFIK